MKNQLQSVEEFHRSFNVKIADEPELVHEDIFLLRHRLMEEENNEYKEACWTGNLTEIADALGDQLYILCGTILSHGLQHKIEEVFAEIQRSNMSKLGPCPADTDGDGTCDHILCDTIHRKPIVREDGKILKGPHYFKPNIERILNENNTSR